MCGLFFLCVDLSDTVNVESVLSCVETSFVRSLHVVMWCADHLMR